LYRYGPGSRLRVSKRHNTEKETANDPEHERVLSRRSYSNYSIVYPHPAAQQDGDFLYCIGIMKFQRF